ncbi:MAG: hypothetical protein H0V91_07990 [Flavisolibacter sp.]|jgi:4-amino-4-deoxy-L-arabinose transferase-like glycosyltransferase|nr:hypothetical protein [Flavisolibacter sp.]
MQKKWIYLAGTLLLVMTAGWLYYLYQQPRKNVVGQDAEYELTAVELYNAFEKNEAGATAKYVDKILVVTGTIKEISETAEHLIIKLIAGNDNGGINAELDKENKNEKMFSGNIIKIKGRCTGFLSDVYLVDCIIEN